MSLLGPWSDPPTTDSIARLNASLAERYTIERELGAGGMATVYLARDGQIPVGEAVRILREIADALAYGYAHGRGVVHRDMKPEIVMRCLEKNPSDRPQKASELFDRFDQLVTTSGSITPTATAPHAAVAAPRASAAGDDAAAGHADSALVYLQSLLAIPGNVGGGSIELSPRFAKLRNDPRYIQMMKGARR